MMTNWIHNAHVVYQFLGVKDYIQLNCAVIDCKNSLRRTHNLQTTPTFLSLVALFYTGNQ